jgi:hypothetical protein
MPTLHESYTDGLTLSADAAEANANYYLAREVKDIPKTGIIPDGYYSLEVKDERTPDTKTSTMMALIAPGCKLVKDTDPRSGITPIFTNVTLNCLNSVILTKENTAPTTPPPTSPPGPTYNPYDINEIYHDNDPDAQKRDHQKFDPMQPGFDLNPSPLYDEPGTYLVDSTGYVPNYADSLYLSTTTGLPQTYTIQNAPYMYGGFCKENAYDKQLINAKCNKLDKDVCASTECCVLLGGQKCVAGNQQGPSIPNSYSDFTIVNRDFYYYAGKCYGNCQEDYFGPVALPGMPEGDQNAMILSEEAEYDETLYNEFNQVVEAGRMGGKRTRKPKPTSSTYPTYTWPVHTPNPKYPCMPDGGDPNNNRDLNCTFKKGVDPNTGKNIKVCTNDNNYTCQSPSCCEVSPTPTPTSTKTPTSTPTSTKTPTSTPTSTKTPTPTSSIPPK